MLAALFKHKISNFFVVHNHSEFHLIYSDFNMLKLMQEFTKK